MTLLKNVNLICGVRDIDNGPLEVFSEEALAFFNDLSSAIFKSKEAKQFPDLLTFAFWCRKANLAKLKEDYQNEMRLGRGICFHIAPSNIPINFAFSYAFSLLSGNANIVKLPSRDFPQVDLICSIINNILENHSIVKSKTSLIKYPRESTATEYFSQKADCRMIWGGDQTISTIKKIDAKPRVVDILFADRYSFCLIDAKSILNLDENELTALCNNFYNDTFLMDQNACSSPQLICWINDDQSAREKFWNMMIEVTKEKYELQDAVVVDKYSKICEDAIDLDNISKFQKNDNYIYRVELANLNEGLENLRGKSGYFYEYSLNEYSEIFKLTNSKYQTLTFFGINPSDIVSELIKSKAKGIDRVVPIGKALDIDIHWDGHDLIRELSREIIFKNI